MKKVLVVLLLAILMVAGLGYAQPELNLKASSVNNLTTDYLILESNEAVDSSKISWYKNDKPLANLILPFEEEIEGQTLDYSGLNNKGLINGAIWNQASGHDEKGAYEFKGNESISVLNNESLNSIEKFSISVWVKYKDLGNWYSLIYKFASNNKGTNVEGYGINNFNSNPFFDIRWDSIQSTVGAYNVKLNPGQWYHIVGVYHKLGSSIYVNGELSGSDRRPNLKYNNGSLYIGGKPHKDMFASLNGWIDDITIFNYELTDEQIKRIYAGKNNEIDSSMTEEGDVWKACYPLNASNYICSNSLIISPKFESNITNTAPTQNTPLLVSSLDENLTFGKLIVYNQSTVDAEQNKIKNIINWYKNSTSLETANYPFELNSSAKDYSESKNDLDLFRINWLPYSGIDGRGAYYFNGEDSFMSSKDNFPITGDAEFTISTWIKKRDYKWKGQCPIFWGSPLSLTGGAVAICFDIYGENSISVEFANSNGYRTAGGVIDYNKWHHIAVTKTSGSIKNTVKIYLDGQEIPAKIISSDLTPNIEPGKLILGNFHYSQSNWFKGELDEVKIYSKALSAEQIKLLAEKKDNEIIYNEVQENDVWKACITPNDGLLDGEEKCSNEITVLMNLTIPENSTNVTIPINETNTTLPINETNSSNSTTEDNSQNPERSASWVSGGSSSTSSCSPDWICGDWKDCSNGKQTRVCRDDNSCGTSSGKPEESQSCTVTLPTTMTENPLNTITQTEIAATGNTGPLTTTPVVGQAVGLFERIRANYRPILAVLIVLAILALIGWKRRKTLFK